MQYYFNVQGEPHQDEIGLDLPDLAAVRREANHHARDILAEHVLLKSHCEQFVMIVTDDTGALVWSLSFSASAGEGAQSAA